MLCSAVSREGGGGGSSRPLDKGGGVSLPKNLFLVWSKIRGGPGLPWIPTVIIRFRKLVNTSTMLKLYKAFVLPWFWGLLGSSSLLPLKTSLTTIDSHYQEVKLIFSGKRELVISRPQNHGMHKGLCSL